MSDAVLMLLTADGPRPADPAAPVLRADDLGVLRGESVFETVRLGAGRPAFLAAHLERLARSAARVDIALPSGWAELAAAAAARWGPRDGVLRLVCSKGAPGAGPVGFALVTPVPAESVRARTTGIRVVTLTLGVTAAQRGDAPWLLGGVKSTSYAVNMASVRQASSLGADDALWVSADGQVLEGPTSTVCWTSGDVLVTPPASTGVLAGTTLDAVEGLGIVKVDRGGGSLAELQEAVEVLFLSSVRGVAPVVELDGVRREVGPVARRLGAAFEALVGGAGPGQLA